MTFASSTHFDQAARQWDERPLSRQLAAMLPRLLEALPLIPGQELLDFGSGTGMLSVPLAQKGAKVTALDTSAAMLDVLEEKQVAGVTPLKQDIFAGLPQRYDGLVSCMALHHVADTQALLEIFSEQLNPGGYLALVDLYAEDGSFHGDNEGKGVKHFGFEPQALEKQLLAAGFTDINFQEIHQLHHKNGRSYPLFLLRATKPSLF
ncbi:class I SAM-dependent DNA methyltransferase [Marinospirillum perlucidum]|uniref:class I SAM-dependent DNA methyltransferase n=1 Tax=Marinospirillum perlucidum TaxID=1982602 RepID=UPI000DF11B5A|nr:class I SAM-dependent methyltransferase [Marinospirillum perlucidum]